MLTIRLQRVGKAKKPTYRLIVSEKARDTQGHYLELLGSFNPQVKENQLVTKTERIQYWIGQGATMSPTVNNLFVKAGIVQGKVAKSVFLSKKRAAKIVAAKAAISTAGPEPSRGGQAEGPEPSLMPKADQPMAEEAGQPVAEEPAPAPAETPAA